jgi:O-acetyl-ADP-ribose deacetylase (regulator of RNase III)
MSIQIIKGNIFTSNCQTLVNTVNCVGVMGAGIALECRLRYPQMHKKYIELCDASKIDIGLLWIYKSPNRWILNFPTKKHWKYPSKKEYLHAGLEKLIFTYKERGINSIAFPLLGADKGGISQEDSLDIMVSYLEKIPINIEIYKYDPKAKDDLYSTTKNLILAQSVEKISELTGLRKDFVVKVTEAMKSPDIVQVNQLSQIKGIGIKTLEKIFQLAISGDLVDLDKNSLGQKSLF